MRSETFATTSAILVLLAQSGFAQVDLVNTNTTLEASSFVGTSTGNSYPPAGSTSNVYSSPIRTTPSSFPSFHSTMASACL